MLGLPQGNPLYGDVKHVLRLLELTVILKFNTLSLSGENAHCSVPFSALCPSKSCLVFIPSHSTLHLFQIYTFPLSECSVILSLSANYCLAFQVGFRCYLFQEDLPDFPLTPDQRDQMEQGV